MTLEEAKTQARLGVKMTHIYFTDTEYMTMKGNMIVFEDGCQIMIGDWSEGKEYLKEGWSKFEKDVVQ